MSKKIILVGSSAAAIGAAVKLRSIDTSTTITCITASDEMPYNRCLLADFLAGTKQEAEISTKDAQFFKTHNIDFRRSERVLAINSAAQTITTSRSESVYYDALFLGIGRSSHKIQIPGAHHAGVIPFYSKSDVRAIKHYLEQNRVRRAIVIGGGLSGIEAADALYQHGLAVDIIEQSHHLLPHQMSPAGAQYLEKIMLNKGITIWTNQRVEKICGSDHVDSVMLADGQILHAELVVMATGGKSNVDLAIAAGIACGPYGIITNEQMQTSIPTIFAGGDICQITDLITGQPTQSSLWAEAILQGMTAACSIMGVNRSYHGAVTITSSHIFGTPFVTAGPIAQSHPNRTLVESASAASYEGFLLEDGRLRGFCLIGSIKNIGELRKLLISQECFNPRSNLTQMSV